MNRNDFNMLQDNLIYFDNAATTLKPNIIINPLIDYYTKYTANSHRGDYDNSLKVDAMYENTRKLIKEFINAESSNEIVFTSGATDSLNKIIFGFFTNYLTQNDEVLITKSEHASNVLPWFELQDKNKITVSYIPLTKDYELTLDNVKKAITKNTKVISIAHMTNVVGDIRPLKEIIEYAHQLGILVVVDGAQSIPHIKVDVRDLDIDFLAFSAHKMCGPTGVGVLYGKKHLLDSTNPIIVGGGMNATFLTDGNKQYDEVPAKLEAGTPNIAGVIAFGTILEYLNNIGIDCIHQYELELKKYAIKELKKVDNLIIYNEFSTSGIITVNYKDVFAQDLAIYLNKYHICVRAGNHCAKILKDEIGIKNTVRISLYFYNTKEEIDYLVKVLNNENLINELF